MKLRTGFFEVQHIYGVQHTYGMGDDPGSPPASGWSYERSVDS